MPTVGPYELYYLFPLTQEQATLDLVRTSVVYTGILLVLLLAFVAWLVTRQVVVPVRAASQTAARLAEGNLSERMKVKGTDDLARLATSFNAMAVSLARQIRQLEELSRVQQRFVSDVSHELRTPLTTIRMAADLVYEDRDVLDAPSARAVELLQNQLDRFEALLVDLLEISRFDAGAAVLDLERVDLVALVQRAIDGAQPLAERNGLDIRLVTADRTCLVDCDPRRVHRIIRNLIENAIEHGDLRGVDITIAHNDEAVAVSVRDFGVGLRPGESALVFNRFWRADPARARTTGGTGLGLSISLEDARLHGGWLEAWGEPGHGRLLPAHAATRPGGRLQRVAAAARAVGPGRRHRARSSRSARTPPAGEPVGVPAQSPAATFVINGGDGSHEDDSGGSPRDGDRPGSRDCLRMRRHPVRHVGAGADGRADQAGRAGRRRAGGPVHPRHRAGARVRACRPSEVVQGFLDASASFDGGHAVARQYLTAEASADWETNSGVTVYDGVPALSELGSAVVMAVREAGTIAENGRYEVKGPAAEFRTTFDLTKVDGEWRIDDLPKGLLLSQSDVDRAFRSFSVYFFNPAFETLVPDPRMVPVIGPGLATTLVRRLVAGPSDWLQPAVRTGFPAGVRLNIDSVPIEAGVARVDLTANAREADDSTRQALSQQIVWTLRQLPDVAGRGHHGGRPAADRARGPVAAAARLVAGRRSERAADRLGRVRGSTRGSGPTHPGRGPAGAGRGRHR